MGVQIHLWVYDPRNGRILGSNNAVAIDRSHMLEAALSNSRRSPGESSTFKAPIFSPRRSSFVVLELEQSRASGPGASKGDLGRCRLFLSREPANQIDLSLIRFPVFFRETRSDYFGNRSYRILYFRLSSVRRLLPRRLWATKPMLSCSRVGRTSFFGSLDHIEYSVCNAVTDCTVWARQIVLNTRLRQSSALPCLAESGLCQLRHLLLELCHRRDVRQPMNRSPRGQPRPAAQRGCDAESPISCDLASNRGSVTPCSTRQYGCL